MAIKFYSAFCYIVICAIFIIHLWSFLVILGFYRLHYITLSCLDILQKLSLLCSTLETHTDLEGHDGKNELFYFGRQTISLNSEMLKFLIKLRATGHAV